ncbi:MAG: 2-C-methyl-D-erythritol 4-phosphate cytidylyltransferase [Spirosomaceae bacterium]|jgi:2-C-methyl-D-erythritol 4-phosphate cytidylyltransferase|nr:2-C-methyl-D-erythritol 4-phosphate cytidylyltransferase [Spirosomataceae bacterium]
MQNYAIIVAGGSGSRMGSEIPKQFLPINNKPILFHTIEKFLQIPDLKVILVLPKKDIEYWDSLSKPSSFQSGFLTITEGGASRFQSVKNGLGVVPQDADLVAVHDGVRPLVSLEIIQKSYEVAAEKGSAVTSVMLKDSARRILENGDNEAVDRTQYRLMQTPQTFKVSLMKLAFESPEQPFFTDCASVLEYAGHKITLIEGSYENIKITTPEDLILAEAFLKKN